MNASVFGCWSASAQMWAGGIGDETKSNQAISWRHRFHLCGQKTICWDANQGR